MVASLKMDTRPVDGFADAIARHEFDSLAAVLHPEVRFRALTPNNTFGLFGATSVIATLKDWFGDKPEIELVASEIEPMSDRIRMSYRFRTLKDGVWTVVEQQAYCIVEDALISDISIICTGYRPD